MDLMILFQIFAILLVVLMLLVIYQIIKGPTQIDRVVVANIIGTKAVSLLIIVGIVSKKLGMFVDLALTYALLNFLASLVAGRFLKHVNRK